MATKINKLEYALLFCIPYLVIAICVKIKFSSFRRYGDFSYGMYIYAFPVQQFVMHTMGDHLNLEGFFVVSFIITLAISILSWKFIEGPALKLKKLIKIKSPVFIRKEVQKNIKQSI